MKDGKPQIPRPSMAQHTVWWYANRMFAREFSIRLHADGSRENINDAEILSYGTWLRREVRRISRDPARKVMIREYHDDGDKPKGRRRIALFVNCISPRCASEDHAHLRYA